MNLAFVKYQGAGNDFILIDARERLPFPLDSYDLIKNMCDRHFGIGADGLMLLRVVEGYDFEMVYYNSDGRPSTMCGNGGRCIVAFAATLGIERKTYHFLAVDGPHAAQLLPDGQVALGMNDVKAIERIGPDLVLDTGSPHYVRYVNDLTTINVVDTAHTIRYNDRFSQDGINVNFIAATSDGLQIATYERGVEGETLACGTGVTAAAISAAWRGSVKVGQSFDIPVLAKGGHLRVTGKRSAEEHFTDLRLIGPAEYVFRGFWTRGLGTKD